MTQVMLLCASYPRIAQEMVGQRQSLSALRISILLSVISDVTLC